jgi:hypothetical protein
MQFLIVVIFYLSNSIIFFLDYCFIYLMIDFFLFYIYPFSLYFEKAVSYLNLYKQSIKLIVTSLPLSYHNVVFSSILI